MLALTGASSPEPSALFDHLDGDGAPDLVVNNVNLEVFVYRNNGRTLHSETHFPRVRLEGEDGNRFGVGARVIAYAGDALFMQEELRTRGFQSGADYVLDFGLDVHDAADSLRNGDQCLSPQPECPLRLHGEGERERRQRDALSGDPRVGAVSSAKVNELGRVSIPERTRVSELCIESAELHNQVRTPPKCQWARMTPTTAPISRPAAAPTAVNTM